MEEYRRGSVERKCCMANLARLYTVENLHLRIGTRARFVKFIRKWELRWPSILKQSVMRSVGLQSEALRKDVTREMEGVAAETDITFTTDFLTSPMGERFMMMSMHWITRDWRLKTRMLGMINFPQVYIVANISNKLMDLRLEFGAYPKSSDGKPLQSLHAVRVEKVMYFQLEPAMDKLVLTSDCGSDVSAGAERDNLWDWNRCAYHCLNIVFQAALKEHMIQECLVPLTALARRVSKS